MTRLILLLSIFFISCNQNNYGEKNDDNAYSYYFNSVSGDNSDLGSKDKPLKSLDLLNNIKLKDGDKILLANGSTFINTIEFINKNDIEVSNYEFENNRKIPKINSKGKIAGIFIENSSNIKISNIEITANGGGPNEILHKKLKSF